MTSMKYVNTITRIGGGGIYSEPEIDWVGASGFILYQHCGIVTNNKP